MAEAKAAVTIAPIPLPEHPQGVERVQDAAGMLMEDYIASMPRRYRSEFGKGAVRQHARIVAARGERPVHAELFTGATVEDRGLCVVATDAPGLLAAISSALMLEGFDVTRADAYTRKTQAGYEAVDFLWVRRVFCERVGPLDATDVAAVLATLRELLGRDGSARRLRPGLAGVSPGVSETSVRFTENHDVPWLTLELESNDRPGLLAVVTDTLFAEGIQIVDCRIRTHGLRVNDAFDVIEADGTCPNGARLQRLQLAVIAAVDGPEHGA